MESYIVSLVGVIFEVFFANVFFKKFGKPKVKPAVFYLVNACCLILQEANNIVFLGKSVLVTVLSLIIFLIISLIYDGTEEDFIRQFERYAEDFDAEEHAEMYINMRGKRGVPNCTIRELLNDAEEIKQLYEKTLKDITKMEVA